MLVGRERIELPETYVAGFTVRPASLTDYTGIWVEHRDLNSNLQCHKLPCCRYTMNHILAAPKRVRHGV